jgi:hypothetical protein
MWGRRIGVPTNVAMVPESAKKAGKMPGVQVRPVLCVGVLKWPRKFTIELNMLS